MIALLATAAPVKPMLEEAREALSAPETDELPSFAVRIVDIFNSYSVIFLAAFLVTLILTPLARRLAIHLGVVDRPDATRKLHEMATPYLGGLAVFTGLIVAIFVSFMFIDGPTSQFPSVPPAVVIGMLAITFTGLADDLWGWDPRLKIAGQLIAAAALATNNIGVRVAAGMLDPIARYLDPILGTEKLAFVIPGVDWKLDLIYWCGTAIIALFVLGGCNAANLIDGLDGLLSGIVAIVAVGLLAISVMMTFNDLPASANPEEVLTGARLVLCFALLGAVLGFLPHNFNPATIFLGDCGSLLLGYVCVTIILMLGEFGATHLVFAGLIVFTVPIMDTALAIVRRRLSGKPMSAADNQHIHHQLKRSLGGVKKAVFALYGLGALFAVVGVTLAALAMYTDVRLRVIYVIAIVLFSFIGVVAIKAARRQHHIDAVNSRLGVKTQASAAIRAKPSGADEPTSVGSRT